MAFNTYQTTRLYDEALLRHSQYIRWTRALLCPCVNDQTSQPDPQCSLCKGRGRIYTTPGNMTILNEVAKHDSMGRVYPKYSTVVGTPTVTQKDVPLTVLSVTDGVIQLATPYPKAYETLKVSYDISPELTVTAENSTVYGTNLLRTIATQFVEKGKTFEGSIIQVLRVYNVTKDETYTVSDAVKEYIYLTDMGTWESGDVLEVNYTYMKPFKFLFTGVSQKMRYEREYIMDEADALLVTPSWVRVTPDDLFTILSGEQVANAIIDPTITGTGNDRVTGYFDISKLLYVVDLNNNRYVIGTDVELYGRDELRWLTSKPTTRYSVQFTYHPTFTALQEYPSVRNSEDKVFVNRINLKQFDRLNTVVNF